MVWLYIYLQCLFMILHFFSAYSSYLFLSWLYFFFKLCLLHCSTLLSSFSLFLHYFSSEPFLVSLSLPYSSSVHVSWHLLCKFLTMYPIFPLLPKFHWICSNAHLQNTFLIHQSLTKCSYFLSFCGSLSFPLIFFHSS